MLRKLLPLFSLFLVVTILEAQQTAPEGFFRLDSDLRFTKFLTENTCYALGTNSTILRSDDRGITWQQQYAPGFELLNGVDFSDQLTGFVVGSNGTLLKTSDGGKKWKTANSTTQKTLTAVSAKGNRVVAVGSEGIVLTSSDNGDTWTPSSSGVTQNLTSILLLSNGNAIAAGTAGTLLRSTDYGSSWSKIDNPSKTTFTARNFSVLPSGTITLLFSASAETSVLLTSLDEGLTWTWKELNFKAYSHSFPRDTASGWFAKDNQLDLAQTKNGGKTVEKINNFDSTLMAVGVPAVSVSFTDEMNGVAVGFRKVIYTTGDGGNSWMLRSYFQAPTNTAPFYKLHFINDTVGWVGAYNEKIFSTRNGGATWLPQRDLDLSGDYGHPIFDIKFLDESTGFAVSNRFNGFLKTTDGGINWNEVNSTPSFNGGGLLSVLSPAEIVVFPAYDGSALQTTNDGAQTWLRKEIVPDGYFPSGGYTRGKDTIGYFLLATPVDEPSYIIHKRSIDGGETYQDISVPIVPQGKGVGMGLPVFISSDTAYAIGLIRDEKYKETGLMLKSTDAGTTWFVQDSAATPPVNQIAINGNKGYGVGLKGNIIKTDDRGKTWKAISSNGITRQMFDIAMPSENVVYIASDQNMLFKGVPADVTTSIAENEAPEITFDAPIFDIYFRDVYPNPASGNITLKLYYSLALNPNDIQLNVYNIMGERVELVKDAFHITTGNNPALIQWNTSNLPSGMYYLEACGGNARMAVPILIAR
jgi:photosystem II stability/assembly factor-like uncharacterized protein